MSIKNFTPFVSPVLGISDTYNVSQSWIGIKHFTSIVIFQIAATTRCCLDVLCTPNTPTDLLKREQTKH